MIRNDCCKDCADRHPGCHGKCERYIDWKRRYEEDKASKAKSRFVDEAYAEGVKRVRKMYKKRKH